MLEHTKMSRVYSSYHNLYVLQILRDIDQKYIILIITVYIITSNTFLFLLQFSQLHSGQYACFHISICKRSRSCYQPWLVSRRLLRYSYLTTSYRKISIVCYKLFTQHGILTYYFKQKQNSVGNNRFCLTIIWYQYYK